MGDIVTDLGLGMNQVKGQRPGKGCRTRSGVTSSVGGPYPGQVGERESPHPFTSLIGQELDALAVVGPCPVVPWHQLPAAIVVTATVGMACSSMGRSGRAKRYPATEALSFKSWYSCSPHPTPAHLTFVIEVINVVWAGCSHHLTWCPQWPAQDVVPLRQAGVPCAHKDRQRGEHHSRRNNQ